MSGVRQSGGVSAIDSPTSPARLIRAHLGAYPLTPREAEVVWLMASGLSNKEIAVSCGIALQTVKDHLKHVYAKAGAHQRTALLAKLIGMAQ
jgi:DNA-binding CsgD family transcriptional regulator